ncbi:MAG: ABC transporter substrate-binding protein [Armatimonadota bacterium]
MMRHIRRTILLLTIIGMVSVAVSGCPSSPGNREIHVTITDENGGEMQQQTTREQIEQAARSEGELNWYTSLPMERAEQFVRLFENQHNYIRVRITRESTFDIVRRVEQEIKNRDVQADVMHVLDPAIFTSLKSRGDLYRYHPEGARGIPPEYKSPGYWTGARLVVICMARSSRISEEEAPETWMDLLNPQWRGRIALKDAQTSGSAYAQYYFLREKYGRSFWANMAGQAPTMYKSGDDILQALIAGDKDIAGGVLRYKVQKYMDNDAPVEPIWPADGVPVCLGPVAILRACPHPNAAKLFVEFMLSQEGQTQLSKLLTCYSPRSDVPPPEGARPLSELNLLTAETGWKEYLNKQSNLRAEYGSLFHPESE